MKKCRACGPDVWLHDVVGVCDREIFKLPQFKGKSCFEIYHSEHARGLFTTSETGNENEIGRRNCNNRRSNPSHPVWIELRKRYNLSPKIEKRKRKATGELANEEEEKREDVAVTDHFAPFVDTPGFVNSQATASSAEMAEDQDFEEMEQIQMGSHSNTTGTPNTGQQTNMTIEYL